MRTTNLRRLRSPVLAGLVLVIGRSALIAQVEPPADSIEVVDPVPALIGALEDPNPWVRRSALNALDDIGDPRGADPIRRLLDDTTDHVRRAAEAIVEDRRVRSGITLELASGDRCSEPDARELERPISDLADGSKRVRAAAANELGRLCQSSAVGPLAAALNDDSKQVRQSAAYALGHLGDPGAVPALLAARWDPEGAVRQAVASALAELCDARSMDTLVQMLFDPDEHVRQVAASGLGRQGDRRAAWALIVTLGDENAHVRQSATNALGLMFAPPGIQVLDAQRCAR